MRETMATINRRVSAKISRMPPDQARELIAGMERGTIEIPAIRELTGGYASQAINTTVMRKLGVKAGCIKSI